MKEKVRGDNVNTQTYEGVLFNFTVKQNLLQCESHHHPVRAPGRIRLQERNSNMTFTVLYRDRTKWHFKTVWDGNSHEHISTFSSSVPGRSRCRRPSARPPTQQTRWSPPRCPCLSPGRSWFSPPALDPFGTETESRGQHSFTTWCFWRLLVNLCNIDQTFILFEKWKQHTLDGWSITSSMQV